VLLDTAVVVTEIMVDSSKEKCKVCFLVPVKSMK